LFFVIVQFFPEMAEAVHSPSNTGSSLGSGKNSDQDTSVPVSDETDFSGKGSSSSLCRTDLCENEEFGDISARLSTSQIRRVLCAEFGGDGTSPNNDGTSWSFGEETDAEAPAQRTSPSHVDEDGSFEDEYQTAQAKLALEEELIGVYETKSTDKKTVMLMQLSEDGRWEHVARRSDSVQNYCFQGARKDSGRWWLAWLPSFACAGSSGSSPSRSREQTVKFWDSARCVGTWRLETHGSRSVFHTVELSCDTLDEWAWTSGKSDPEVHFASIYSATEAHRRLAIEVSEQGRLSLSCMVNPVDEETGLRSLGLLESPSSVLDSALVGQCSQSGAGRSDVHVAVQALGFARQYGQLP